MKQTLTMRKANLQKAKFSTLFFVLLTILSLQSKAQLFNEDFDYLKVDQRQKKISEDIVKVLRGDKIF